MIICGLYKAAHFLPWPCGTVGDQTPRTFLYVFLLFPAYIPLLSGRGRLIYMRRKARAVSY